MFLNSYLKTEPLIIYKSYVTYKRKIKLFKFFTNTYYFIFKPKLISYAKMLNKRIGYRNLYISPILNNLNTKLTISYLKNSLDFDLQLFKKNFIINFTKKRKSIFFKKLLQSSTIFNYYKKNLDIFLDYSRLLGIKKIQVINNSEGDKNLKRKNKELFIKNFIENNKELVNAAISFEKSILENTLESSDIINSFKNNQVSIESYLNFSTSSTKSSSRLKNIRKISLFLNYVSTRFLNNKNMDIKKKLNKYTGIGLSDLNLSSQVYKKLLLSSNIKIMLLIKLINKHPTILRNTGNNTFFNLKQNINNNIRNNTLTYLRLFLKYFNFINIKKNVKKFKSKSILKQNTNIIYMFSIYKKNTNIIFIKLILLLLNNKTIN